MKKGCYFLIATALGILLSPSSCGKNETKQRVYYIGEEYEFETIVFKSSLDTTNEMFSFEYRFKKENASNAYFSFNFEILSLHTDLDAKNSFKYTDKNDKTIVFDEYHTYSFKENSSFYVSYKDSPDSIKQAIAKDDYSIEVSGKKYIPKQLRDKA